MYVKKEYRYHLTSRKQTGGGGSNPSTQLSNWTEYLSRYEKYIEKGFQFTRLAVQEPNGVMILRVRT